MLERHHLGGGRSEHDPEALVLAAEDVRHSLPADPPPLPHPRPFATNLRQAPEDGVDPGYGLGGHIWTIRHETSVPEATDNLLPH